MTEGTATRVAVAALKDFPPGTRRLVEIRGRTVGVFRVGDEFFALLNRCPHQGGPLCEGATTGLVSSKLGDRPSPELSWSREGQIIRCPWHAWEFDMRTGRAVFGEKWRIRTYPVYTDTGPPGPVETYETVVQDSVVYVDLAPMRR
jgi:nitrite reductase/ring-hydroxylating ferredoxin subunit